MSSGRRIFPIENYVSYDNERDISTCLQCNREIKGKVSTNIKRHYRSYHQQEFDLDSDLSKTYVPIGMTKNEFVKCCVGLVTMRNLPFQFFDDDQFLKKLIAPYEKQFGTNFNSLTMANHVNNMSQKLKEHIYLKTRNKMVCLKLDVAMSMDKMYSLAILTIQYIQDYKTVTNAIGVLQLNENYTEMILKSDVMQCLNEVKIEIGQIYSCTPGGSIIDIGPNVLKASILLKELQESWLIDNDGWDSMDEDEEKEAEDYTMSNVLSVVRCAEHNVQLAADDVFEAFTTNIDDCRTVVKTLQIVDNFIDNLDNTNKWNTTYTMFKSLESLRNFIENAELRIVEIDWTFVTDFVCAFKPLFNCAIKFGSEPYILGDFYRDWLMCEIELEEIVSKNGCAQLLLEAMENRKVRFLENNAFLAALYVDPRFNFINTPFLTSKQKCTAVDHLLNTHSLVNLIGSDSDTNIIQGGNTTLPCSTFSNTSNAYYKLERKMKNMAGVPMTDSVGRSMEQKLNNLAHCGWVPFDSNVLQYWKKLSNIDPELGKLIQLVLSVPAKQISEECAVRALSVLNQMSCLLSDQTINDLILIKLNHVIFDNVDIS